MIESLSWNQTHRDAALAAQRLDVPVMTVHIGGDSFLQLGQGARRRLFHETVTYHMPLFARNVVNKAALNDLLAMRGIPLPKHS